MGRRPRIHYPGAVYHAYARGVDGQRIFVDDQDRHDFLDALKRISRQADANVIAYCLMTNHFHLAIRVARIALSTIMHRLLSGHVLTFNMRHERVGHLFQSRHAADLCVDDAYLSALIPYIHKNPVRANMVAHPRDWPWSSYRDYEARGLDGLAGEKPDFNPWKRDSDDSPPILLRRQTEIALSLPELGTTTFKRTGISVAELCSGSKRHPIVSAKNDLIRDALLQGHRSAAIAEYLGITPAAVTRYLRK